MKYNLRVNPLERIGAMQRKNYFLIAVLLFLLTGFLAAFQPTKASPDVSTSSVYAPPPIEWIVPCAVRSVSQTSDGGFISFGGSPNAYMVRASSEGEFLWNRTYGKVGYELECFAGQQTSDGGYMLIGGSRGFFADYGDAWLGKTDETGDMLWNRTYGGEGHEYAFSGQQTADGGYILAGVAYPLGINNGDFYLVKTDSYGNMEWNKTYGGSSNEAAWSVQQTSDGGCILAGETYSFGAGYTDCWLVKTDSNGKMEWNKTYGGNWFDVAYCVRQTTDGGYVFAGFQGWDGGQHMHGGSAYVFKTNSSGEIESGDGFSGTPADSGWARAYSVKETSDGGFIVAGDTSVEGQSGGRMFLLKTHSKGSGFDWSGIYGGNDQANARDAIQTTDGGYAVAGSGLMKILADRPLVARFKYSPSSPVSQESIVFDATYSYDRNEDIVSYLWNFDDGNITSIMSPLIVHQYENPGIYNVSLRVVDAEGLNSSYALVLCAKIPTSISLSTVAPSATAGYSVSILGTLLDFYGNRIRNESVALYYAYSGYENWNTIASELTDSSGSFSAAWIPPAPSYFVIKAVYAGNYTHVESNRNVTLSMLPYGEDYLFTVESNSTVSSMGFSGDGQTLSFTATGAGGTKGYAKVTTAKTLVPDLASLSVYVDGIEYSYNVTEVNNSWVLLFVYDHSAHLVEIRLDSTIAEFMSSTLLLLFLTATLFAAIGYKRKSYSSNE